MTRGAPKLLFIHPSDELYGADRMLLEFLAALDDEVQPEVWLPTDLRHPDRPLCESLRAADVPVRHMDLPILRRAYRTPRALLGLGSRTLRLAGSLRRLRPDIAYCTTSATFLGAIAAKRAGVPRVVGHVQEIWTARDGQLLGWPAGRCDELLTISEAVARSLPLRLRQRAHVIPNGTQDPGESVPIPGDGRPLRFVVASRWNGWKGHTTLLRAWDLLERPAHLAILGGSPSSGTVTDVPALVSRLRHPDSVEIVGEVPDVSEHLTAADVVLVPSDSPEPFGLVAIEAFARGRPVVGSAAGGLAEVITHGLDGWLFPPGDARALADVLDGLDRASVRRAGLSARATYEERYTSESYRERWRDAVVRNTAVAS